MRTSEVAVSLHSEPISDCKPDDLQKITLEKHEKLQIKFYNVINNLRNYSQNPHIAPQERHIASRVQSFSGLPVTEKVSDRVSIHSRPEKELLRLDVLLNKEKKVLITRKETNCRIFAQQFNALCYHSGESNHRKTEELCNWQRLLTIIPRRKHKENRNKTGKTDYVDVPPRRIKSAVIGVWSWNPIKHEILRAGSQTDRL